MRLKRALTKPELDEFRRLAEGHAGNRMAAAIHTLLIEVDRLKAAFVPRPVPEASWLVKDFHVLYRAAERLVAHIDAEGFIDLDVLRAQLQRLAPAFEQCEVERRMGRQTKEPSDA